MYVPFAQHFAGGGEMQVLTDTQQGDLASLIEEYHPRGELQHRDPCRTRLLCHHDRK
jgi:hypothetical protein